MPPLPYAFDALEPHIDAKTMEIHHDKHHATYVTKLNEALDGHPELQDKTVEELLRDIDQRARGASAPPCATTAAATPTTRCSGRSWARTAAATPTGELAEAIHGDFGGFEAFKEKLTNAAANQFGSGWGWLVASGGKLDVIARPTRTAR